MHHRIRITPKEQNPDNLYGFEEMLKRFFTKDFLSNSCICKEKEKHWHYHISTYCDLSVKLINKRVRYFFGTTIEKGNAGASIGEQKTLDEEAYLRYICKGKDIDTQPDILLWENELFGHGPAHYHELFFLSKKLTSKEMWQLIEKKSNDHKISNNDLVEMCLDLHVQHMIPIDTYMIKRRLRLYVARRDSDYLHILKQSILFDMQIH